MLRCKPVETPIESNGKIKQRENGDLVDRGRYQCLVGRLIYLSHTRPDIAFVVSVVSQYMHSPFEEHLEVVYRILRYLKDDTRQGIILKNEHTSIEVYTDADWVGSIDDRKSTSG
ncbi:LOW QUALITY PROTEIN: hypothetical protein PanWU01x14_236930 [Parasponia andersonii]|uniref:Uncharacterized protein n=1 Tax=Parasponia andersonii TaxID=3476 RepID=A0A2P5BI90_PARAD|nr:LOW QUALITY PROTEIN: hypothetical protein PanWU01x14_236930 [Parasponia andersonii]